MKVLVIGSAQCVEDDLAQVDREDFDIVIGVNEAAYHYGPVDYHVTLHPEKFAKTKQARMVANKKHRGVDEVLSSLWDRKGGNSGSSGLFAVKFSIEKLKARKVVLAGVPIVPIPHFNDDQDWIGAVNFRGAWIDALPQIKGKVTSLSGWTAELLNGGKTPTSGKSGI